MDDRHDAKENSCFCAFGKYRNIEVEDDVTAYAEYENGATAVFITTTGEAPGTNRYEVTGTAEKSSSRTASFWRLRVPEPEFNRQYTGDSRTGMLEMRGADLGDNPR